MSQSLNAIVYSEDREVQSQHCDVQNHLNNVVYVQWTQDIAVATRHEVFADYRSKGYSREFDENNHIIWFVRRHEVDYLSPAFVGDGFDYRPGWRVVRYRRFSDGLNLCGFRIRRCYVDRPSGAILMPNATDLQKFQVRSKLFFYRIIDLLRAASLDRAKFAICLY